MHVLLCRCQSAGLIDPSRSQAVIDALRAAGRRVICVDDLCAMAAAHDPRLAQWAQQPLCVIACYERAVSALFRYADSPLPDPAILLNLRTALSPQDVLDHLKPLPLAQGPLETIAAIDPAWPAWFPVIDYTRCRNCRQCLNFCLFGVYAQTEQKTVKVVRPQSCKNGCPACARVCPDAAIVFPKYDKSPVNGDRVDESAWRQSHAQSAQSFKHRLTGSVYEMLHRRDRVEPAPQNMDDLRAFKEQFDIPDRLFENLPGSEKRDS